MAGVNKVIIVGRLGADPEVRNTQTGQTVCTLSLATSESWVKDGKKEERTEWHRVVLWAKQAELAQRYLKKGRMVYIEGRLQTRSWQDNQGQKRYTTEIIGNTMQFIDGGSQSRDNFDVPPPNDEFQPNMENNDSHQSYDPYAKSSSSSMSPKSFEDDIPF